MRVHPSTVVPILCLSFLAVISALISCVAAEMVVTKITDKSGQERQLESDSVQWPHLKEGHGHKSDFHLLRSAVSESAAKEVIETLTDLNFQTDMDSVDQEATFQYWLFQYNKVDEETEKRKKVLSILRPILDDVVMPLIDQAYPGEGVTPCFSFIRRYTQRPDEERMKHPTHFDIQSYATFVVSLGDINDFTGGLYVATAENKRHYFDLARGDGALHQSDLLHGVQVFNGTRWSWIVWFMPGGSCDSNPTTWHKSHAEEGDPIHQFLHAHRLHSVLSGNKNTAEKADEEKFNWLKKSAKNGFARAQNEVGHYLRTKEGKTADDLAEAKRWLQSAIETAQEPEAYYNMGLMMLDEENDAEATRLFQKSCEGQCVDACENLAIAYFHGRGGLEKDLYKALELAESVSNGRSNFLAYQMIKETTTAMNEDDDDEEAEKKALTQRGLSYLRRAAVMGNPDGEFFYGYHLLRHGTEGGAENEEEKRKSLQKSYGLVMSAAKKGHASAIQLVQHLQRMQREQQSGGEL